MSNARVDDTSKVIRVMATYSGESGQRELMYTNSKVAGNGSFGVVYEARTILGPNSPSGAVEEDVAIKKVLQDKRFKNRELQIMRLVKHPNVVDLRAFYYTSGDKAHRDELYLYLVLEYVPETLYRVSRSFQRRSLAMAPVLIKLYMYQIMRSLAYIHSMGICHRDIKPQNLLLDPKRGALKLCDFGSAKILVPGEPNVSYICSRYYRAPELIFGAVDYTTAIDIWSAGCVMAELMLGQPLFLGESGIDQLVEIIKILGTPTKQEISTMNPNYMEHKFPPIQPHSFSKVFRSGTPSDAIVFISKLLLYTPSARLSAIEALADPYFDELRSPSFHIPDLPELPALFDFKAPELSVRPDLIPRLVPPHAERFLLEKEGIDVHNFTPLAPAQLRVSLD